jgi:hypothetical protein
MKDRIQNKELNTGNISSSELCNIFHVKKILTFVYWLCILFLRKVLSEIGKGFSYVIPPINPEEIVQITAYGFTPDNNMGDVLNAEIGFNNILR